MKILKKKEMVSRKTETQTDRQGQKRKKKRQSFHENIWKEVNKSSQRITYYNYVVLH